MTEAPSDIAPSSSPAKRRRWLFGAIAAGAVGSGVGTALWRQRSDSIDVPADGPEFLLGQTLQSPGGESRELGQWRGRALVVNFWATWCPPCIDEMPELSALNEELAPRGIVTLGIAIDAPSAVRDFLRTHPVSYPILIGGMAGSELYRRLGNHQDALPYTVVIDPKLRPRHRKLGRVDISRLRSAAIAALE